jgi:hypothetical protein
MAQLGKAILLDLLKSPNDRTRLKAEESLRAIAGYGAPTKTELSGAGGAPLFVPLNVDPKDIVGDGTKKQSGGNDEKK